jgi:hypothetical protein
VAPAGAWRRRARGAGGRVAPAGAWRRRVRGAGKREVRHL